MLIKNVELGESMVNIFGINLHILIPIVIGSLFFISGFIYIGKNEIGIKIERFGESLQNGE